MAEAPPESKARSGDVLGDDEKFMQAAESEAEKALDCSEVPVGCVFVRNSEIVASGHNLTNVEMDATRHAEMVAIDKLWAEAGDSCKTQDPSRQLLQGCTLYVTCEPCIMDRVVFGCANDKFGGNGSVMKLQTLCAPAPEAAMSEEASSCGYAVTGGLRGERAVALFKKFYARENTRAPEPKKRKEGNTGADEAQGAST